MNFNNIPMGLRVPIFFGEISINGSVPAGGGGTNPQPPIINCDGALTITDPIEIDGDWVLEVDGELVRPEATSIDDVIDYLNEAGFEVTVESPVIGCEGATPTAFITTLRKIGSTVQEQSGALLGSIYNINGQDYSLEDSGPILAGLITGESLPSEELPPPEIIPAGYYYHYGNESSEDVSVYTAISKITNVSDSNLRLEMKAGNANLLNVIWNNPTALKNQVCMSPAPIVEPTWDIKFVDSGETVYRLTGSSIPNNYADNAPAGNIGTEYIDVTSLTIGDTVNSIGSTAFRGWQNAQELIIEEGLSSIGDYAFYFWSSITQVVIPASVTHIGANAFGYWESCNSFTFLSTTPPTIGDTIIHSVAPNTKIYVPASAVDTYKNDAGWSFYANDIFAIQ